MLHSCDIWYNIICCRPIFRLNPEYVIKCLKYRYRSKTILGGKKINNNNNNNNNHDDGPVDNGIPRFVTLPRWLYGF